MFHFETFRLLRLFTPLSHLRNEPLLSGIFLINVTEIKILQQLQQLHNYSSVCFFILYGDHRLQFYASNWHWADTKLCPDSDCLSMAKQKNLVPVLIGNIPFPS